MPINSTTKTPEDVSHVEQDAPLAHLSVSAPLARTLPSLPEEEFALTAPIPALLVTELELVLHASVDSTTSKAPVNNPAPMEPTPSTEFASASQESSLSANV